RKGAVPVAVLASCLGVSQVHRCRICQPPSLPLFPFNLLRIEPLFRVSRWGSPEGMRSEFGRWSRLGRPNLNRDEITFMGFASGFVGPSEGNRTYRQVRDLMM